MKTYDIFEVFTGQASDGFRDVNGYIMSNTDTDVEVAVIPYGDEYAAPLVTSGPPNQLSGITNGTFASSNNATAALRPATTISGQGSGATFTYLFDGSGNLSTIVADGAGTGYLEGDHLSITTTSAHGSQTIKFRLVEASNQAVASLQLIHDAKAPLLFPVRKVRIEGTDDKSVIFLREQV